MSEAEALKYAFVEALKYLKTGYKPSGKIKEKLLQKGCSPQTVNTALLVLEKKKYLKDELLAKLYVEEGLSLERIVEGPWFLKQRLKNLGYSSKAIQEAMIFYDETKALENFLKIKVPYELANILSESLEDLSGLYAHKDYQKILKKASNKGFSFSKIRHTLEEILMKERESLEE